MGLFWLRTGYMTHTRRTRRIRNAAAFHCRAAIGTRHSFNWIISPGPDQCPLHKSRLENAGQAATTICAACEWIKSATDAARALADCCVKFSLEFDTRFSLRSSPYLHFIQRLCFRFFWLICYNICSPWEPRGQLIETTLNLLILSQIKRRFINTHRQWGH